MSSGKPLAVVTRRLLPHVIEHIKQKCDVLYWDDDLPIPREKLLEWAGNDKVEGLYCLLTDKIDEECLSHAKALKVVSTMSVGFDHIDVNACKAKGIAVGNTPGVLTDTTADLAVALLMCTARRLVEGNEAVKNGLWPPWNPMWMTGIDVTKKTVGIVGMGRIGFAVACRLMAFGCKILYYDKEHKADCESKFKTIADAFRSTFEKEGSIYGNAQMEYRPLNDLLQQSDFVTLHTVLSEETKHLISVEQLKLMKKSAILINTSRGGVVDQDALLNALNNGEIKAAGLDVVVPEPLPSSHPLVHHPNCVILPHIGSGSVETRTLMQEMAAENLLKGVANEKLPNGI